MPHSRVYPGLRGGAGFRLVSASVLAALVVYFLMLLVSLFGHTDPGTLARTASSREILDAVGLSLATATLSTFLAVLIGVPAAYALSQTDFPGKAAVDTVLDAPIVVSPVAMGAALLVFFSTPLGAAIEGTGLRFVFEVPGIVLAQFTVVVALTVRLMKSTFDGIDRRYEQVGRTLGLSKSAAFFRIVLPMSRDGLVAACILTWARAVGEFGATVTLSGAMRGKTVTLPASIFLSLSTADVAGAVAAICVLVAIAAAALLGLRLATRKGYPA